MLDMMEVISVLGVFGTIVFAYLAFHKTTKDDSEENGKETGQILTELGYVKKGIDDLNAKIEKQEERYLRLIERIAKVEQSAKSAHKRIDQLTGQETREDRL